jgi:hypothetical protein
VCNKDTLLPLPDMKQDSTAEVLHFFTVPYHLHTMISVPYHLHFTDGTRLVPANAENYLTIIVYGCIELVLTLFKRCFVRYGSLFSFN